MENELAALFDHWAKEYDNAVSDGQFPFTGYTTILNEVVRLADVSSSTKVLDLGIGTGNLAGRFVQKGCLVWGLDFSSKMLAQTRNKWPQVQVVQGDLLTEWPSALQGPFERIVSAYVFHEFDLATKIALLQHATMHYLAPGSRMIVADIAFPTIKARADAYERLKLDWDEDEFYWAADETIRACEPIGLQVTYQQVSECGGIFIFTAR